MDSFNHFVGALMSGEAATSKMEASEATNEVVTTKIEGAVSTTKIKNLEQLPSKLKEK